MSSVSGQTWRFVLKEIAKLEIARVEAREAQASGKLKLVFFFVGTCGISKSVPFNREGDFARLVCHGAREAYVSPKVAAGRVNINRHFEWKEGPVLSVTLDNLGKDLADWPRVRQKLAPLVPPRAVDKAEKAACKAHVQMLEKRRERWAHTICAIERLETRPCGKGVSP